MITLSKIFVYPIKSTAPVELDAVSAEPEGLAHDRRYVVTDEKNRFLTARRFPRMLLIRSEITGESLRVTAPEHTTLLLSPTTFPDVYEPMTIWRDTVQAQRCGAEADEWMSRFLGIKARLFYMGADSCRTTGDGGVVSFADGAPLLVLSEATVADLNTRLAKPVTIRNFRPNFVVSGASAYAEDDWADFSIGGVRFASLHRCARCILTTIDPLTAQPDAQRQPLATLLEYRRGEDGQAYFGRNVAVRSDGIVRTGEPVVFDPN
ncbi:MAG: MOSC domain-containing protein [Gammaproteobacteria bacterium]|nr:MOSC domain-containing protein [Gammaproteobacteria bacterium]